ncbi:DUF2971 domain-containing protein [Spirosoma pomorum]
MMFPFNPPVLIPRQYAYEPGTTFDLVITTGEPPRTYTVPPKILYHYTGIDTAAKILSNRNLRFSSPESFNDPFDLYDGLIDKRPKGKHKKLLGKEFLNSKPRTERKRLQKLFATSSIQLLTEARKFSLDVTKKSLGICCFSKRHDIGLLWSHYACKHKGVCLGFDFEPVNSNKEYVVIFNEVNYKSSIEPLNYYESRDAALENWIYSKSTIWSYEEEVRAFIYDRNGARDFDFERACLKEVYFGCNTTEAEREPILKLLEHVGYKNAIKKKMIIDPAIFNVRAVDV